MNRVFLIGRLGKNPEHRSTTTGKEMTSFSLATDGYGDTPTEWHNVVVWGKQAAPAATYLKKGSMACVEGSIRTHTYETKTGEKREMKQIVATSVIFLDKKEKDAPSESFTSSPSLSPQSDYSDYMDDIPF